MSVYDKDGALIKCVKPVSHRGYQRVAPENTMPAFELAVRNGYRMMETDIEYTSDGIAVLLHDATISRTSNGSGTLSQMTFAQVRQYDFGSWKSEEYAGTLIPTLDEFLTFCAQNDVHPYLELKSISTDTQNRIEGIVDAVGAHGLTGRVTYISLNLTYLEYVKAYDPTARLGYVVRQINATNIANTQSLSTGQNHVAIISSDFSAAAAGLCRNANLPMEAWNISNAGDAVSLDSYISGVLVDGGLASVLDSAQGCANMNGSKVRYAYDKDGNLL